MDKYTIMIDEENVCCPDLEIVSCGDTDEHKHPICLLSLMSLENTTIRSICIGDFCKCVLKSVTIGGNE